MYRKAFNIAIAKRPKIFLRAGAAIFVVLAGQCALRAQLASPPMQLPTHSAFSEDAKPGVARLYDLPSLREQPAPAPKPVPRAPVIPVSSTSVSPSTSPATPTSPAASSSTSSAVSPITSPYAPPVVSLPEKPTLSMASSNPTPASDTAPPPTAPELFNSETKVAMVPPSTAQRDYVPNPPYATSPLTSPGIPPTPPADIPFFSLRPSFIPEGAKSGMLQQSLVRATYLPRLGDDGFGMTSLNTQITLALPPFISGSPILLTPSYTTHFLDGPSQIGVPPQLIDGELEFRYMKQATPRLGIDLAVAPSYFGDGHNNTSEAWRVTGRALGAWSVNERWQIIGGGVYTGRSDFPAVPAVGAIWKPNTDVRIEAIFPRPRAYYRPFVNGTIEHWFYIGGEYGGNTWAIDQPTGATDKMTYSDLRLLAGWERRAPCGINGRFELGWVFDRSIEFESGSPGFDPSDTLMVRGELSY